MNDIAPWVFRAHIPLDQILDDHILNGYWKSVKEAEKACESLIRRIVSAEAMPRKRWQYKSTLEETIVRGYCNTLLPVEWLAKQYGKTIEEITEILRKASAKEEFKDFFERRAPP